MKMDINDKINEIIFKYQLDSVYPHYRNMCEAEKILRNTISNIIKRNGKAVFVGNDKTGIEFIRNISRDYDRIHFFFYDKDNWKLSQLENANWTEYEEIYLISFYGAEYVERWFRIHNIQYSWIYDIFEQGGAFLQREFYAFGKEDLFSLIAPAENHAHTRYGWSETLQCELYVQRSKYESTDNDQTKYIALKKCLFLALYIRDFVAAQEYVRLLLQYDKQYNDMWQEVEKVLHIIKENVCKKTSKDIICYWLDSIPYGDEKDMPYLQSIKENSIVFENAFTYVANTHPTLRAMFLGKKDIDDRVYQVTEISQDNSPLMQLMLKQGYKIKIITAYFNECFSFQYLTPQFYTNWFEPASRMLWDLISNMFIEKQKTFWVVHIMDTHFPYLGSRINDDNYGIENERYKLARIGVDEQLAFYESFLNRDATRIYMSDHGQETLNRFHVLFNIYQRKLQARKISGLTSLLDFDTIIQQIVVDKDIKEEEFVREYVEIGCLDRYSYRNIARIFKDRTVLTHNLFGFKGIVDKEYVYIRYKTGREWLQKRNNLPKCDPLLFYKDETDVCEPKLLWKYRQLTGEYPCELDETEYFKYSGYLHALYRQVSMHNNMNERVEIINQMLEPYSANSIAIRMGGRHSLVLYHILTEENKRRIWGIIDSNNRCICCKLNLPIISFDSLEQLREKGIKAVILSSYDHLETLRQETERLPDNIDILDIYKEFDRNTIRYEGNFYQIKGTDEDYAIVDFPFN